jgi:hypothetical protein
MDVECLVGAAVANFLALGSPARISLAPGTRSSYKTYRFMDGMEPS